MDYQNLLWEVKIIYAISADLCGLKAGRLYAMKLSHFLPYQDIFQACRNTFRCVWRIHWDYYEPSYDLYQCKSPVLFKEFLNFHDFLDEIMINNLL